jgi:hypothetical protein
MVRGGHSGATSDAVGDSEYRVPVGDLSQVVEGRILQAEVVAGRLIRDVGAAAPPGGGQVGGQHRGTFRLGELLQPNPLGAAATQDRMTIGGAHVADPLGLARQSDQIPAALVAGDQDRRTPGPSTATPGTSRVTASRGASPSEVSGTPTSRFSRRYQVAGRRYRTDAA